LLNKFSTNHQIFNFKRLPEGDGTPKNLPLEVFVFLSAVVVVILAIVLPAVGARLVDRRVVVHRVVGVEKFLLSGVGFLETVSTIVVTGVIAVWIHGVVGVEKFLLIHQELLFVATLLAIAPYNLSVFHKYLRRSKILLWLNVAGPRCVVDAALGLVDNMLLAVVVIVEVAPDGILSNITGLLESLLDPLCHLAPVVSAKLARLLRGNSFLNSRVQKESRLRGGLDRNLTRADLVICNDDGLLGGNLNRKGAKM
jgi:hypothetical protein